MPRCIRTLTSLCLILLVLSLVGWPTGVRAAMPSGDGEHGWIQVVPDGRYFQFEDGTPFFAVGHNEWSGEFIDLCLEDPVIIDHYLAYMHEHGENVLRLIFDGPGYWIEDPVGTFNPRMTAGLDCLVAAAERQEVYLLISPWVTVNLFFFWGSYPYNSANGGPVDYLHQMFTDPEAIEYEKARLRWLVDNWGDSPAIFAWDLVNEMNGFWDPARPTAENIALHNAWINEMGAYIADYEASRYGRRHLRTVSTSDPNFPESLGDGLPSSAIYDSPELDFVSYHTYSTDMPNTWEGLPFWSRINPVGYVLDLHSMAHTVRDKAPDRPVLDTEDGAFLRGLSLFPWWQGYTEADFDETFLAANWATFTGGAAGTGLRWPASPLYGFEGNTHLNGVSENQADSQLGMARFAAHVDWTTFAPGEADGDVQIDLADVAPMALSDGQTLVGWLLHDTRHHDPHPIQPQVTFAGLSDEPHTVAWFDDATGDEIAQQEVEGTPILVTAPPFERHIAVLVQPAGPSGPAGTRVFLPVIFK